jgi:hypothetical protein
MTKQAQFDDIVTLWKTWRCSWDGVKEAYQPLADFRAKNPGITEQESEELMRLQLDHADSLQARSDAFDRLVSVMDKLAKEQETKSK